MLRPATHHAYKFANRALVDDSKIFVKKKGAAFQMSAEEEEEERILNELRYMDLPEEGSEFLNLESVEPSSVRGNRAIVPSSTVLVSDVGRWHSISSRIGFANHFRSIWSGVHSASSTSSLHFSIRYNYCL